MGYHSVATNGQQECLISIYTTDQDSVLMTREALPIESCHSGLSAAMSRQHQWHFRHAGPSSRPAAAAAAEAAARRAEYAASSSRVASSTYPAVKHAEPSAPPDQAEASAPPMSEHMAQACNLLPSFAVTAFTEKKRQGALRAEPGRG